MRRWASGAGQSSKAANEERDLRPLQPVKVRDRETFAAVLRKHSQPLMLWAEGLLGDLDNPYDAIPAAFVRALAALSRVAARPLRLGWLATSASANNGSGRFASVGWRVSAGRLDHARDRSRGGVARGGGATGGVYAVPALVMEQVCPRLA